MPTTKKAMTPVWKMPATKNTVKDSSKKLVLRDSSKKPVWKKPAKKPVLKEGCLITMDVDGFHPNDRHNGIFTCEISFSKEFPEAPTTIVILRQIASGEGEDWMQIPVSPKE